MQTVRQRGHWRDYRPRAGCEPMSAADSRQPGHVVERRVEAHDPGDTVLLHGCNVNRIARRQTPVPENDPLSPARPQRGSTGYTSSTTSSNASRARPGSRPGGRWRRLIGAGFPCSTSTSGHQALRRPAAARRKAPTHPPCEGERRADSKYIGRSVSMRSSAATRRPSARSISSVHLFDVAGREGAARSRARMAVELPTHRRTIHADGRARSACRTNSATVIRLPQAVRRTPP